MRTKHSSINLSSHLFNSRSVHLCLFIVGYLIEGNLIKQLKHIQTVT